MKISNTCVYGAIAHVPWRILLNYSMMIIHLIQHLVDLWQLITVRVSFGLIIIEDC